MTASQTMAEQRCGQSPVLQASRFEVLSTDMRMSVWFSPKGGMG